SGHGVERGYKKLPGFNDKDAEVTLSDLRQSGGLVAPDVIWHDAMTRITASDRSYMVKALRRGEKLTSGPTIHLSTIHSSKGGQADHVVLMTDVAWRTKREGVDLR